MTNEDRVGVGVIGCGDVALYAYLPELRNQTSRCRLAAVCDLDAGRAERAARLYAVDRYYAAAEDLLADPRVEAVLVLTPIPSHYAVAMQAIWARKHVYIEKPIATSVNEATRLMDAAQAHRVQIGVAPAVAVAPALRALYELVRSQTLGSVTFARVYSSHGGPARPWYFEMYHRRVRQAGIPDAEIPPSTDPTWFFRPGGGGLLDMAVYAVAQITFLLGSARQVAGMLEIGRPEFPVEGGVLKGATLRNEVDDQALMLLDFGRPPVAYVEGGYCVPASRSPMLEVFFTAGSAALERDAASGAHILHVYRETGAGSAAWDSTTFPVWKLADGIPHFLDCVRTGAAPVISAAHARHVLEILIQARESSGDGCVRILRTTF